MITRGFFSALLSVLALSGCQARSTRPQARARPGPVSWSQVSTIAIEGFARYWEPGQSEVADGESRFIGSATFHLSQDTRDDSSTIEWHRQTEYPFRRAYDYREVLFDGTGILTGGDSWAIPKDAGPHPLSSDHFANERRELVVLSPWALHQRMYAPFFSTNTAESRAPESLHAEDVDATAGDSSYDISLSDFRDEAGLRVAHRLKFSLNGRLLREITLQQITFNAPLGRGPLAVGSPPLQSDSSPGGVPYQWVSRRVPMGGYSEAESTSEMHFVEVAPGVELVAGRSHNALVVEQARSILVVDAPLDEAYTAWVTGACKDKFPTKPIGTLVLTHHHNDHTGGARGYVAAGVRVMVGSPNRGYFERVFDSPHRLDNDLLQRQPRQVTVSEIDHEQQLDDAQRPVQLFRIENTHAQGMLIVYLPVQRLGFVADLWSPGARPLGFCADFRSPSRACRRLEKTSPISRTLDWGPWRSGAVRRARNGGRARRPIRIAGCIRSGEPEFRSRQAKADDLRPLRQPIQA